MLVSTCPAIANGFAGQGGMLDIIRNILFLIYPESSIKDPASLRIKRADINVASSSV